MVELTPTQLNGRYVQFRYVCQTEHKPTLDQIYLGEPDVVRGWVSRCWQSKEGHWVMTIPVIDIRTIAAPKGKYCYRCFRLSGIVLGTLSVNHGRGGMQHAAISGGKD